MNKTSLLRRLVGFSLGMLLIMTFFFSAIFIGVEMGHHHHDDENCPICATMEECVNNIRTVGAAVIIVAAVSILLPRMIERIAAYYVEIGLSSPLQNRVRLNN